jgi:hypothetical protein
MMSPVTIYLGRFFGLSCLILCVALAARPKSSLAAINGMMDSPGLILVTGIVTMFGGVAAVLGHNIWSGGALPIVVTVLGWATLIKGVALIATPPPTMVAFYKALHYAERFRLFMGVSAVLSLWLTVAAFLA